MSFILKYVISFFFIFKSYFFCFEVTCASSTRLLGKQRIWWINANLSVNQEALILIERIAN